MHCDYHLVAHTSCWAGCVRSCAAIPAGTKPATTLNSLVESTANPAAREGLGGTGRTEGLPRPSGARK